MMDLKPFSSEKNQSFILTLGRKPNSHKNVNFILSIIFINHLMI